MSDNAYNADGEVWLTHKACGQSYPASMQHNCTATAVEALDALDASDPERAHALADDILLTAVPQEVRDAYVRVGARCSWWAFA